MATNLSEGYAGDFLEQILVTSKIPIFITIHPIIIIFIISFIYLFTPSI